MNKQTVELALSKASLKLLTPLARVLLRNGVSYGEFAEWAKRAFVQVAHTEFGTGERKSSVSRISALTGLTRKEAKRVLELDGNGDHAANERYNRATRVITGWLNDDRYATKDGRPQTLPIEGDRPSFTSLVRDYSGDIPARAMLEVLASAQVIVQHGDTVELVKRAYVPGNDPIDMLHILGTDGAELISTIDYNLTSPPQLRRFQRKVSNIAVEPAYLAEFKKVSSEKAQRLLEELDTWLSEHEAAKDGSSQQQSTYVSVGIYYYDQFSSGGTNS